MQVGIKAYLRGLCQYRGCMYNEDGRCLNNDSYFLSGIVGLLQDSWIGEEPLIFKQEIYFECHAIRVLEGHCYFCGNVLQLDYITGKPTCPKC